MFVYRQIPITTLKMYQKNVRGNMVTTDCQQTVEILANKPEKAYTAVFIQEDTKDVAIALCC